MADRLEANNIICNYQARPNGEGFTASGALRMGVSEMTRFGMEESDLQELAGLIRDVILDDAKVTYRIKALRSRFCELKYCFRGDDYDELMQKLYSLL